MRSTFEVYLRTRKVPDFWWNLYVCRPLAAVLVACLEKTRVTPDQITLVSFAVAVAAAGVLLTWPGYLGLVTGVLVLEASYVLDCTDGMLARLRGTASPAGHLLDFLMDELKAFALVGAVAVRLYREHAQVVFLLLGIAGLVTLAMGIAITSFQRRPEIAGPRPTSAGLPSPQSSLHRAAKAGESVGKFLIHYPSYIWLPAALGRIEFFLVPYVAIHAAYAVRSIAWLAVRFSH